MEIRENLRYPSLRAKIIYLAKSDFSVQQDMYFIVFWGAEQILFNKKFWFISQKMGMLQNLRYRIFKAKRPIKEGHSTSKNLIFFYCSIHELFRKHLNFEKNNSSDGSFEIFVVFRPLIINFFCLGQIEKKSYANFFFYGKGYYAQWAPNSVEKCLS